MLANTYIDVRYLPASYISYTHYIIYVCLCFNKNPINR